MNTKELELFLNAGCGHAAFSSLHSVESKIMSLIFLESTCFSVTQAQAFCGQKEFISGFWSPAKTPFWTIEIAFYVSVFLGALTLFDGFTACGAVLLGKNTVILIQSLI